MADDPKKEDFEVPEGHVLLTKEEIDSNYVSREVLDRDYITNVDAQRGVRERLNGMISRSKAVKDESIVAQVLADHKDGIPDLESAKKAWDENEAAPLRAQIDGLHNQLIREQVDRIGPKFWSDHVLVRPGELPSWSDTTLVPLFKVHEGHVVAVGPNGNPMPSLNPSGGQQFAGVEETFERLAQDPQFKPFAKAAEKNSGGPGKTGDKGGSNGSANLKDLTVEEQASYIKEKGASAFLQNF